MSQLAEFLMERISGSLDRFVFDMASHLEARIEAELAQFSASLETKLAAFVAEVTHADSDRRDHDPVPHVRRRARRGLRRVEPQGRDDSSPAPAQAPNPGRPEGERAARLVDPPRDPLAEVLGPELAAMLNTSSAVDASSPRRICGCAARGPHRKECSLPSVSTSPSPIRPAAAPDSHDHDAADDEPAPAALITKRDRFARIEAQAAARRAGVGG